MTPEGVVTILALTDDTWVGQHSATFEVYLRDIDSTGRHAQSLIDSFVISIVIEQASALSVAEEAAIVGSLIRRPPVVLDPIAPAYLGYANETTSFVFNFADPLALERDAAD